MEELLCSRADRALWVKAAHRAFAEDMNTCAPGCLGRAKCTAACVALRQPDLSHSCVKAYGDIAQCTACRCWTQCIRGASEMCEACVVSSCNPDFFRTTGLADMPSDGKVNRSAVSQSTRIVGGLSCSRRDELVWEKSAGDSVPVYVRSCAPLCMGGAKCIAACIAKREPDLTASCALEYGKLAACAARRCWSRCLFRSSASCGACLESSCTPAFVRTTGLRGPTSNNGQRVDTLVNDPVMYAGTSAFAIAVVWVLLVLLSAVMCRRQAALWFTCLRRKMHGHHWESPICSPTWVSDIPTSSCTIYDVCDTVASYESKCLSAHRVCSFERAPSSDDHSIIK